LFSCQRLGFHIYMRGLAAEKWCLLRTQLLLGKKSIQVTRLVLRSEEFSVTIKVLRAGLLLLFQKQVGSVQSRTASNSQHAGHGACSAARAKLRQGWVGGLASQKPGPPSLLPWPLSIPSPPISPGSRRVVGLGRHRPASCIPPRMHRWIIASCGDMRLGRRRSTYSRSSSCPGPVVPLSI
jgi:hypothetical protein